MGQDTLIEGVLMVFHGTLPMNCLVRLRFLKPLMSGVEKIDEMLGS